MVCGRLLWLLCLRLLLTTWKYLGYTKLVFSFLFFRNSLSELFFKIGITRIFKYSLENTYGGCFFAYASSLQISVYFSCLSYSASIMIWCCLMDESANAVIQRQFHLQAVCLMCFALISCEERQQFCILFLWASWLTGFLSGSLAASWGLYVSVEVISLICHQNHHRPVRMKFHLCRNLTSQFFLH